MADRKYSLKEEQANTVYRAHEQARNKQLSEAEEKYLAITYEEHVKAFQKAVTTILENNPEQT